jgi:hypothetical protein
VIWWYSIVGFALLAEIKALWYRQITVFVGGGVALTI